MTAIRSVPADVDPALVGEIEARLTSIEREHRVTIVWAVESGSRAWGFPSPDSDYDCRFIFVRPLEDYLTVSPKRDVIELPIEGELDVNGWDVFKLAKLLLGGNATALEWLTSPIVYRGDAGFRDDWLGWAEAFLDRRLLVRHYLHFGTKLSQRHLSDPAAVKLKKLFYALRPAAALRWRRLHPDRTVVPMHFPTLLAESDVPAATMAEISALLARKAVTRELGTGVVPAAIGDFIRYEFEEASRLEEEGASPDRSLDPGGAAADALVRK